MAGTITIKVNTETLNAQGTTFSAALSNMKNEIENMTTIISSTSRYWQGKGGNSKRNEYDSQKTTVESIINRLKEYPSDLFSMAGVYSAAEKKATSESTPLSSDVIL